MGTPPCPQGLAGVLSRWCIVSVSSANDWHSMDASMAFLAHGRRSDCILRRWALGSCAVSCSSGLFWRVRELILTLPFAQKGVQQSIKWKPVKMTGAQVLGPKAKKVLEPPACLVGAALACQQQISAAMQCSFSKGRKRGCQSTKEAAANQYKADHTLDYYYVYTAALPTSEDKQKLAGPWKVTQELDIAARVKLACLCRPQSGRPPGRQAATSHAAYLSVLSVDHSHPPCTCFGSACLPRPQKHPNTNKPAAHGRLHQANGRHGTEAPTPCTSMQGGPHTAICMAIFLWGL